MSKALHTVLLRLGALALGVVACACGKTLTLEEPSVLAVSDEPIAFAVDGQMTKGDPVTTLAALAAQQFSVSAWYSPDGQAFSAPGNTGYLAYKNHRFGYVTDDLAGETTFPNPWQGVKAPEGGGVTKDPIYWPFSGTLSFFCYAPYRADAALETPPVPDHRDIVLEDPVTDAGIVARLPGYLGDSPLIRVTPAASASAQADLLVAPPLLDKSRFYFAGQSQLDFSRHRMVQVEFWFNQKGFVPYAEKVAVRVTGITLTIAYIRGRKDRLTGIITLLLILSVSPLAASAFYLFSAWYYRWWYFLVLMSALASICVLDREEEFKIGTGTGITAALSAGLYLYMQNLLAP